MPCDGRSHHRRAHRCTRRRCARLRYALSCLAADVLAVVVPVVVPRRERRANSIAIGMPVVAVLCHGHNTVPWP